MPAQTVEEQPDQPTRAPLRQRVALWLGRLGKPGAWAVAHPRIAAAVSAAALLVLLGSVTLGILVAVKGSEPARSAGEIALEALDQGEFEEAARLAQDILSGAIPDANAGVASFVLGALTADQAEKAKPAARAPLFLVAARYLEDALARGLPEERYGEAQWVLGRSLFEAGRMAASRAVLSEALKSYPGEAAAVRFLLAAACLYDPEPKPAEALQQNKLYLAEPGLTDGDRREGLLQQAEILLGLGKTAECVAAVDRIPREARQYARANVLRGRAWLAEAQALKAGGKPPQQQPGIDEKLQAAMTALREAQATEAADTPVARQAAYLIGVCLAESGDARGALHQLERLRKTDPATHEYLAAAFQEAVLLEAAKRDAESAAALMRALRAVNDAEGYCNPWVSLKQLRDRTLESYRQYSEARQFSLAVEVARAAIPVLPADRALKMEAEADRAWGRELLARAESLPASQADPLVREGRLHLRRAGRLWRRLAGMRVATRQYPQDLWDSATCALDGHDFRGAARVFEEYLKEESRGRQALAMACLGESLLSLGRIDEAIAALERCIALYPRDVAALRARLLAAQAHVEKGNSRRAQQLLEENLNGETLTPASKEYRDSLLALGRLLHRAKGYEEAIRRLEEVVNRYGDSRQALEARYLLGDCHLRFARAESEKLKDDVVEQLRSERTRRIREGLRTAAQWYRQTQQAVLKHQESSELGPVERLMLRNSYFLMGSLSIELGQLDAAMEAYAAFTARYPNAPETLEAHVQMARVYRALGKPEEARSTLQQARLLLIRFKNQVRFEQTTNLTQAQWTAELERLSNL